MHYKLNMLIIKYYYLLRCRIKRKGINVFKRVSISKPLTCTRSMFRKSIRIIKMLTLMPVCVFLNWINLLKVFRLHKWLLALIPIMLNATIDLLFSIEKSIIKTTKSLSMLFVLWDWSVRSNLHKRNRCSAL